MRFPAIIVLLACFMLPAWADQLHLRNGRVVEGTLIEQGSEFIVFRTASGAEARFPAADIKKIVRAASPAKQARERLAGLEAKDLKGHQQLVAWCLERKLRRQAREVREAILLSFPDDLETRRALGFVRHEGKWMTRKQYMQGLGLVPTDDGGSWITPEEADRRVLEAEAKAKRKDVERVLRTASTRKPEEVLAALAKFDDRAAVPVLTRRVRGSSLKVRKVAIADLGRRKAQQAELALARAAVEDTKKSVREAALAALSGLELKAAPKYFMRTITREKQNHFRRVHAVQAVGAFPAHGVVPVLIQVLREATSNFGRASISVITQRAYIQDFELSSGGTGRIVAEVADPVIGTFTEGVSLDMKVILWERYTTVKVLRRLTGQSFGNSPRRWQRWWDDQR